MISFSIKETDRTLTTRINKAIISYINKVIVKSIPYIKSEIVDSLIPIFYSDPTTISLLGGDDNDNDNLAGHFGFPKDAAKRVKTVLLAIVSKMKITFFPFKSRGNKFYGKLKLELIESSFKELLKLIKPVVTKKNEKIPWLEYLLFKGKQIINQNHFIRIQRGKGRSGLAIMVKPAKRRKRKPDGSLPPKKPLWRVPSAHAGTKNNNWLTRMIANNIKQIEVNFSLAIQRALSQGFSVT